MPKQTCTKCVTHSNVKIEENKRKAIFRNPAHAEFLVSRIDGCLITSGGKRADYLVSKKGTVSVLVELKGSDVSHACEQLMATIKHETIVPLLEKRIGFLVVCNRYPRFDSCVARSKQHCAVRYGAGFHVVTDKGEFNIERVAAIDGPYED